VLPVLAERGIAPIGMKSLGGRGEPLEKRVITAREALGYAMSLPVAVTVTGIDSAKVLAQNLRIARGFTPFSQREMARVRRKVADRALDGRFELYKTTAAHEGDEGRAQHGYRTSSELSE
jgi:hypothetical protein